MIRKTIKVILWFAVPALLILLLFPSPSCAPRNNDRTHAETTAYNLKNAISAFFTEYRQYPGATAPEGPDIDLDSGHRLMDILLGSEKEAGQGGVNPRRISFYVDKAARPLANGKSNPHRPRAFGGKGAEGMKKGFPSNRTPSDPGPSAGRELNPLRPRRRLRVSGRG